LVSALTGIICGLFGYVAYNNLRLSREIQVRIGFERRLTAVIGRTQSPGPRTSSRVIQSIVDVAHCAMVPIWMFAAAELLTRPDPCDVERRLAAEAKAGGKASS